MKLNIDGSSIVNLGMAREGGVIRDEEGNWVVGFAKRIGSVSSFLAKLWALWDELLLCLKSHIKAMIIEMDAKAIVDAFSHQNNSNSIISSLMDDCKQLVTQIPQPRFRHVYREANRCVDFLAKLSSSMDVDFVVLPSPPVDTLSIFEADCRGLYMNRLCTEPVIAV